MKKIMLRNVKNWKLAIVGVVALLPTVSHAVSNLRELIDLILDYIGKIIPLIFAVTIVVFLYWVFIYIARPAKQSEAAGYIFFSVVALFVMISIWGLVQILTGTFFPGSPFGLPSIRPGGANRSGSFESSPGRSGTFESSPGTAGSSR